MISDRTKAELERSEMDAIVKLFELDISRITNGTGDKFFRFTNEDQIIEWRGKKFTPMPIELTGVDMKSDGTSNRPTLRVGNVEGYMYGVINQFNGLIGAKLTVYYIEERFLYTNPNEYVAAVYMVNAPKEYNKEVATFELALPSETDGFTLPNRTILATVCPFAYRGAGCGYDGHAVADIEDNAIEPHEMDKDQCSKSLLGCKARFGANGQLPFGGFVMADKVGR